MQNKGTGGGFFSGVQPALPIILGYLPVGFAYGVLAAQVGMTPLQAGGMSFFVYAGSAQFIAVSMLMAGATVSSIILITFVVNLRHMLMSAAMTPYLRHWSRPLQAWFGFEMTDESFAVNYGRFAVHGAQTAQTLGLNFFAHMAWVGSGVLGAFLGNSSVDLQALGLDFALAGMFLALTIPWLRKKRGLAAAVCGACVALALAGPLGKSNLHIVAAAVAGASFASLLPFAGKDA